eukprot:CAMPEP_0203919624 /NCGR_PEP_ID=MMETSP0359-20131031/60005_1 /ASSEMBLY_ACC=CAM_ASM_000338 /TAXON_ID=268821 /ORGANISM="Scrippsiella Hangoei, Strain SHTV-5" /LENGTH=1879 /DNA_ID=CAMNT_0050846957 /DNA_START=1 /DNA_END=5640 /DNA_ORIENTATION=-
MMPREQLELVRAGGSYLVVSWRAPAGTPDAEYRKTAWLLPGPWVPYPLSDENLSTTAGADGDVHHVTLTGLDPQTVFDVRLRVQAEDGTMYVSNVGTFSTLTLVPKLASPPEVKCARHDRLLLRWAGPVAQAEEIPAYRVCYFDCEPRWPVRNEIEVKLASRLLRRSEQMTQFLSGQVAMRSLPPAHGHGHGHVNIVGGGAGGGSEPPESEPEDTEGAQVHFWLLNLVPARMYYVQVAAVTAGGLGLWSPKSAPLYTWRRAPALLPPQQILCTHASIAIGLDLAPLVLGTNGQDEEVDTFELVLKPLLAGAESRRSFARAGAGELAARLRAKVEQELPDSQSVSSIPTFVVIASGLSPCTAYTVSVRAITHAGEGQVSTASSMETVAMPPEVSDLRVEQVWHDCASLSWCCADRCASTALVHTYLGEDAEEELGARHVRGFRVRLSQFGSRTWREVIGIRRKPSWDCSAGARLPFVLRDLEPNSHYSVQLTAVCRGQGVGAWSEPLDVHTEALAPCIEVPRAHTVTRDWALLRWPSPTGLTDAPVLGYAISISKGRRASDDFVCELEDAPASHGDVTHGRARAWCDSGETLLSLPGLDPDFAYSVQVTAQTSRGAGASSSCSVRTQPCAPAMAPSACPRLLKSFYNKMLLECDGPVPDWREEDECDIIGYRAKYHEFGGGRVWAAPRLEVDVKYTSDQNGKAVQFELLDLACEREYIVQVAAVTQFGRGLWSAESSRLSTWRAAPSLVVPRIILRTHTALVLGWDIDPYGMEDDSIGHDEEILEFVVQTSSGSLATTSVEEVTSTHISRPQAEALAKVIQNEEAFSKGPDEEQSVSGTSPVTSRCQVGITGDSSSVSTFGEAMLCEGFVASHLVNFVAVVTGLEPDRAYTCTVAAKSCAGLAHFSSASSERATLAVAPRIDDLQVDEVQHDRIQVSWKLSCLQLPIAQTTCDQLGLSDSVAELELSGFDVRCAAWTTWTRLNWREAVHMEIGRVQRDGSGRALVIVSDLDPERLYVVELRTRSVRGSGVWCRVNDQAICTAIDAPAPPPPELVKNTPNALTFSFAALDDIRIVAYEVRHFEGWVGRWGRASAPLRLNADSPLVRVTSERRWVVTIEDLRSETTHALELRGLTRAGGVTKWSAWSEAMSTLRAGDGAPPEAMASSVSFTHKASLATGSSQSAKQVAKAADVGHETIDDLARKLKVLLSFVVGYATAGVQLPSVTVPSIAERAAVLLQEHKGSYAAALEVAEVEDDSLWQSKLPDFLFHQAPVGGCSTILLRELWQNLRRCALIAHLYGHDTETLETQARLFTCLLLPRSNARLQAATPDRMLVKADDVLDHDRVLELVSKSLALNTMTLAASKRATGQVVSSFEVMGLLLRDYGAVGAGAAASAAAAADAGLSPAAAEDSQASSPTRVAQALFKPSRAVEHPAAIAFLFTLWLLPLFVSGSRFAVKRLFPVLEQTVRMDFSLAGLVAMLILAQIVGVALVMFVQNHLDRMACLPATVVFVVCASAPGASIWLATRSTLKSLTIAPCYALLGVYSLASGYLRWADDLLDDSTLEGRAVPRIIWGRRRQTYAAKAHRVLWAILVLDFVVEELLGQWLGLHSVRFLGPPLAPVGQEAMTPAEYQAPAFILFLVAAGAHQRVLGLTKRQTVMVRMLGARRRQLPGLKLFLMGAPSVGGQHTEALTFLRDVSPSKWWCCVVLFLRRWGAAGGVFVPLSLYILRDQQFLGALSKDTLVSLAVIVGAFIGHSASSSFAALWLEVEGHMEAEYRVLYLFPHMRKSTRTWACDALVQAFRQGDDAGRVDPNSGPWAVTAAVRGLFGGIAGGVSWVRRGASDASQPTGLSASGAAPLAIGAGAAGGDGSSSGLRRRIGSQ